MKWPTLCGCDIRLEPRAGVQKRGSHAAQGSGNAPRSGGRSWRSWNSSTSRHRMSRWSSKMRLKRGLNCLGNESSMFRRKRCSWTRRKSAWSGHVRRQSVARRSRRIAWWSGDRCSHGRWNSEQSRFLTGIRLARSHDSGRKAKALSYSKKGTQLWQTKANENVARTQYKCPCNKPCKSEPPAHGFPRTAADCIGLSLTSPKLHSATFN